MYRFALVSQLFIACSLHLPAKASGSSLSARWRPSRGRQGRFIGAGVGKLVATEIGGNSARERSHYLDDLSSRAPPSDDSA